MIFYHPLPVDQVHAPPKIKLFLNEKLIPGCDTIETLLIGRKLWQSTHTVGRQTAANTGMSLFIRPLYKVTGLFNIIKHNVSDLIQATAHKTAVWIFIHVIWKSILNMLLNTFWCFVHMPLFPFVFLIPIWAIWPYNIYIKYIYNILFTNVSVNVKAISTQVSWSHFGRLNGTTCSTKYITFTCSHFHLLTEFDGKIHMMYQASKKCQNQTVAPVHRLYKNMSPL